MNEREKLAESYPGLAADLREFFEWETRPYYEAKARTETNRYGGESYWNDLGDVQYFEASATKVKPGLWRGFMIFIGLNPYTETGIEVGDSIDFIKSAMREHVKAIMENY